MKKIILLLLAMFLGGCAAPIALNMPAGRMHTPEALGQGSLKGFGGFAGSDEVVLTTDLVQRIPNTTDPAIGGGHTMRLGAGAGVGPKIDVELFLPLRLQGKFQFVGKNRQESAKGNFSAAIQGAVGRGFDRGSGNDSLQIFHTKPLADTKSDYEMKSINLDTSLILGWRFHENLMLYGGPFLTHYRYYGGYTQRNTSGSITAQGRFAGLARQKGAHLGLEWGNKFFAVYLEGGISQANSGLTKQVREYFSFLFTAYLGKQSPST